MIIKDILLRGLAATVAFAVVSTTGVAATLPKADDEASSTLKALVAATADAKDGASAVLSDVANASQVIADGDGGLSIKVGQDTTIIPSSSEEPIELAGVAITLPSPEVAAPVASLAQGVGAFDNGDGSVTAPVLKEDGSVQVTTVITSRSAPDSYSYELEVPPGVTWTVTETGGVFATDASGGLVIGIAPAWARDADGVAVPTRYELEGTRLTQIVDHQSENIAYPVVADPWIGANIFQWTSWNASTQTASARVSPWGSAIHTGAAQGGGIGGWAAGQAIMRGAGWDEFRGRVPALNTKATYRQQYDCHVLGAYTPVTGGPTWDLEGYRRNYPSWGNDVARHKCNW